MAVEIPINNLDEYSLGMWDDDQLRVVLNALRVYQSSPECREDNAVCNTEWWRAAILCSDINSYLKDRKE